MNSRAKGRELVGSTLPDYVSNKRYKAPHGFQWFRGLICSDRKVARLKRKDEYDKAVYAKRARGESK